MRYELFFYIIRALKVKYFFLCNPTKLAIIIKNETARNIHVFRSCYCEWV